MRASLLGALTSGFDPVAVTVNWPANQITIPIPAGAVSFSFYMVGFGGNASTSPLSGNGGDCYYKVGNAVAGSTSLLFDFSSMGTYLQPSGSGISGVAVVVGGNGARGSSLATGGAAATEIAAGPNATVGQFGGSIVTGPASITTGSVLAGYVGRGGDINSGGNCNGVGWGGGGGIATDGAGHFTVGVGGPAGALVIFK